MTIVYWEYEPDNWGDCFTPQFIIAWMLHRDTIAKNFNWLWKNCRIPNTKLTSYECLRDLGLYMPRKKGDEKNVQHTRFNDSSSKGGGNEWKWVNIRLEPEDITALEQSTSTFEFLAASLCALGDDGIGFSVKPVDSGKSFCVTLNRPDSENPSVIYGLSSFAGNIHDALLVALYKFDICLEGDFSNAPKFIETAKPQQRFR